jgi:hypothetical protein
MRIAAALTLIVLAGCDGGDTSVNSAQLNRIAFQRNEMEDIGRTARLAPLGAFSAPADYRGPICRFTRGADTLIFAFGSLAAARVDGVLRTFRARAMIGPSGGFYRDNELALSIGVEPGQPARARVTNRLTEAREDASGTWACETQGG